MFCLTLAAQHALAPDLALLDHTVSEYANPEHGTANDARLRGLVALAGD